MNCCQFCKCLYDVFCVGFGKCVCNACEELTHCVGNCVVNSGTLICECVGGVGNCVGKCICDCLQNCTLQNQGDEDVIINVICCPCQILALFLQ